MLVLAAPARAASVEVVADCWKDDCFEHASFVAAPGERNRVVVSHDSGRVVTLTDTGAPLTVGDGCVALSEHRARCTADPDALDDLTAKVWLGDGDDTARLDRGHAYGGPGDDRLSGTRVSLTGGPGKDRLTATVAGTLTDSDGAHPARDVYRGARASVSYAGRRHGVRIDLRAGRAAEDVLRGIHSVTGTGHADTIIGTGRRDRLAGGGGRDRIVALGGDDDIDLDRGTADAGPGDDHIELGFGDTRARCGPGRDRIGALGQDPLLVDCETLGLFGLLDQNVHLHSVTTGLVLSGLHCPCRNARYEAKAEGLRVALAGRGAKTLRLNARGRRLLAARDRLVVTVRSHEVADYGHARSEFRTVLRRPRP